VKQTGGPHRFPVCHPVCFVPAPATVTGLRFTEWSVTAESEPGEGRERERERERERGFEVSRMNGGGNQERTGHLSSPSRPLSRATHSRGILFFFWTVGQTGVCRRFLSCHQIPELFTGLCHVRKWPFSDKTGNRKPVVIPRSVSLVVLQSLMSSKVREMKN